MQSDFGNIKAKVEFYIFMVLITIKTSKFSMRIGKM